MDELFVSVTSNGLPLENESVFSKLIQNKPDKIHITIHHPKNAAEVDRVIKIVVKIAEAGIKSGVNLLVSDFNVEMEFLRTELFLFHADLLASQLQSSWQKLQAESSR